MEIWAQEETLLVYEDGALRVLPSAQGVLSTAVHSVSLKPNREDACSFST